MALTLDLNKSKQTLCLNLQKSGITTPPKIDVAFALDVSGSFDDEHRSGLTNDLMTRLIPWASVFDPDQKMEVYTFSNGASGVHHAGEVNENNYTHYIQNHIIGCPGYGGGTDYGYVLEKILEDFGWVAKKQGFWGKLLGTPEKQLKQRPTLVFIVTDGENTDKPATQRLMEESSARQDGIYFHFIGVSNQNSVFPFIKKLGGKFNNVGFTPVHRVRQWVTQDEDLINRALISEELIQWLRRYTA